MNCQEALDLLYDIIDKEASDIDANEVRNHLDKCRHCLKLYELESAVDDFLRQKLAASDDIGVSLDTLKGKVQARLDEVDCEQNPGSSRSFRLLTMTMVSAAALVLLMGAALIGSDLVRHYSVYYPYERVHFAAAKSENPVSLYSSPANFVAAVENDLGYQMSGQVGGFTLIEGGTRTIDGVPIRHFVYTNNGSTVSVFIASTTDLDIPSDLNDHRVLRNSLEFFDHNCHGCRVVFHRSGNSVIVTASYDREVDLLDFVPGRSII